MRKVRAARVSVPTPAQHAARLVAERTAQNLPPHITDPLALRRVALILRGAERTPLTSKTERDAAPRFATGVTRAPMIEGLAELPLAENAA